VSKHWREQFCYSRYPSVHAFSWMPKPKMFQVYLDWYGREIWRVWSDGQAYHGVWGHSLQQSPVVESWLGAKSAKPADAERDGSGQIIDVALNNLHILIITQYLHSPSSDSVNCYIASAFCQCTAWNCYLHHVSKKSFHLWVAMTLRHMNGFWYFWQKYYW